MKPSSFVYFLWSPEDPKSRVKIGYTKGEPQKRIVQLQPGSPVPLELLFAVPADRMDEANMHLYLARCRSHNEWFFPDQKLVALIVCEAFPVILRTARRALEEPEHLEDIARRLGVSASEARAKILDLLRLTQPCPPDGLPN
jgi:hypothetical protein